MSKKGYKKRGIKPIFAITVALFWVVFLTFAVVSVAEKRLYPTTYEKEITRAAKEYGIEPALMFAVVKTESGFDPLCVSVKGAVGLMQILPSTGEYIAEKKGIAEYDLFDVNTNLDFGGYYWKYLSENFYGITETAAAYNAGEGRVRKWLKNAEYSADGVRLNAIPYPETETYVKKIYESLKRYRKLYGKLLDK